MRRTDAAELELGLADGALIAGWHFVPDGAARELGVADVADALGADGVVWLHFNLANARAAHYLAAHPRLPESARRAFAERAAVPSVGGCGGGLLAVMGDVAYDAGPDLGARTTVWAWADERLAITGRAHAAASLEALRQQVRDGERFASGVALVARIYDLRSERLADVVEALADQVAEVEDRVLDGRITQQSEELGRIRRLASRVRRHVASDRAVLERLVSRAPRALDDGRAERFAAVAADLAFTLEELGEIGERSQLLQGELASRIAEDTNRRMAVLTTVSVVLMPMTVVAGLWGMNTGGVPGESADAGFWWVTLLVVAVGLLTLWLLRRFRLI